MLERTLIGSRTSFVIASVRSSIHCHRVTTQLQLINIIIIIIVIIMFLRRKLLLGELTYYIVVI